MMTRTLIFLAAAAWILPFAAFAQCATGVDTGGTGCVAPEALGANGNSAGPAVPGPLWEDRWGAVVSDADGRVGVANEERTREAAIAVASGKCSSNGSKTCKVDIAFRNTCVAVAGGDKGSFSAVTDLKEDTAKHDSLSSCNGRDSRCDVVYSACSAPVRVR
ncbi:DUF4189 domain-containing protein [Bacillus sp. NP157]|nr:DUF4189 domain-containing protein [Bacillus sp. NP157]